jgi:hypothetical protein
LRGHIKGVQRRHRCTSGGIWSTEIAIDFRKVPPAEVMPLLGRSRVLRSAQPRGRRRALVSAPVPQNGTSRARASMKFVCSLALLRWLPARPFLTVALAWLPTGRTGCRTAVQPLVTLRDKRVQKLGPEVRAPPPRVQVSKPSRGRSTCRPVMPRRGTARDAAQTGDPCCACSAELAGGALGSRWAAWRRR